MRWHVFVALLAIVVVCSRSSEEDSCDLAIASNCENLINLFKQSLLSSGGIIFKIRNLLVPSSGVFPELAQITYRLKFVNNSERSTMRVCPCLDIGTKIVNITSTKPLVYKFGWTTIGLYTYIHPALLNQLQLQLPMMLMSVGGASNVPFLWDGCNQLPSVTIDLSIPLDNLTCVPSLTEVDAALEILTSQVRLQLALCIANYYFRKTNFLITKASLQLKNMRRTNLYFPIAN